MPAFTSFDEVLPELEVVSREARNGRIHYRVNSDMAAGSITGAVSLFMPDKPSIESA